MSIPTASDSPRYRRAMDVETANFLSHAFGLLLSIMGGVWLLRAAWRYGDAWRLAGCGVYVGTLVALYAASSLSHGFERPRVRHFFRTLDQACIFLLIAGTMTPFVMTFLWADWGWLMLACVWAAATAGIVFKVCYCGLNNVTVAAYVLLGWLPIAAIKPLLEHVPGMALALIVAGGVLYTVGVYFLNRDERAPHYHVIWHLLVIAGSACHYLAILLFVVPWPQ